MYLVWQMNMTSMNVYIFCWIERLTFNVEPLGPISRCRRFTNRSLFLTSVPILMMSHATSSSNIRTAWGEKRMSFFFFLNKYPSMCWESAELCHAVRSEGHLFKGDTPGQQLDQVSGLDDGIRIKRFLRGTNWNAALNQVQGGFDMLAPVRVQGEQWVTQEKEQQHTGMLHSVRQINQRTASPKAFSTSGQHSFR